MLLLTKSRSSEIAVVPVILLYRSYADKPNYQSGIRALLCCNPDHLRFEAQLVHLAVYYIRHFLLHWIIRIRSLRSGRIGAPGTHQLLKKCDVLAKAFFDG
jgi:hypothetical protein